ncbi:MAG: Prophage regulatory protein (AlpA) [Crocinitomicaceae bacterium]|jgi:predicted DNA-binding transcriptional regulator AlpA|nr:Prophage regulatory protein (AlpA) [Crocinitomicaceae bacterium]
MELKMINLAIGKLSDDVEQMKEQIRDILFQITALKTKRDDIQSTSIAQPVKEPEFITLKQVREILKMSRNSVLQMIKNGLIHPVRLTKRTVRFVKSEIQALIKA